jgi:hypothetical protein
MSRRLRRGAVICCLEHVASLRAGDELLDVELATSILVSTAQDFLYLFPAAGNIIHLAGIEGFVLLGKLVSNLLQFCLVAPFIEKGRWCCFVAIALNLTLNTVIMVHKSLKKEQRSG